MDKEKEREEEGSTATEETVVKIPSSEVEIIPQTSEWQRRHMENEQRKDDTRNRIRANAQNNQDRASACFRPAKPAPSIDDDEHKVVAVYARVSTAREEQISSIENQTLYYTKKIEDKPNWEMQEIYSDEGKSGTSMRHRDEFKRMIQNAKLKKFDMIICASVSRFARNVSDCLDQVLELKTMNPSHPIGVYFETENIYTLNPESDQALGIHALLADWESANKSRRMILSYDQRILTGQYPVSDLLGYRHTKDGDLVIVEEEAKTVRFIFLAFISGYDCEKIAEILTEKQRPTLRGRQDWNRGMVANVMQNERRWGELEARKTIVVDYKKGKTAKNNNERCSAYVPEHHEPIVSPEIARAARCVFNSTVNHSSGVVETNVIERGSLKGFVSVNPSWGGMDNNAFHILCRSVYEDEELESLHRQMDILEGKEHSNITHMGLSGFQVPYGVGYLTNAMPSITFSKNNILFNKACHDRFNDCRYIEIYYHPILQTIVIRESDEAMPTAVAWKQDDKLIKTMPAKEFCKAVYDNMCWKKNYKFRVRGITKERDGAKIMFFFLDEPQILLGAKQKQQLEAENIDMSGSTAYIPYKEEPGNDTVIDFEGAAYGYPEEWNHSIGMNYELRARREAAISSITAKDILEKGAYKENPLIGHISTKEEIQEELEELLMSM